MPKKHKIKLLIQDIAGDGCHVFIVALVNDQTARLLIDTGASKTVLDKTFVMSLDPKVNLEQSEELSTGFGAGNIPSEFASIIKFEVGDMTVNDITVAVLDLYHVNETYQKIGLPTLHGVVGGDLLLKHNAVIDYKKETLKLTSKKLSGKLKKQKRVKKEEHATDEPEHVNIEPTVSENPSHQAVENA